MFTNTLSPATKKALEQLNQAEFLDQARLAGGTGLALQIGHRESVDLDFFTNHKFNPDEFISQFKNLGQFSLQEKHSHTVLGIFEKTKLSYFYLKYPWLEPSIKHKNLHLAGLKDIAAMKLAAIADRGTKRDFIDLYFLAQIYPLKKIFNFYQQRFANLNINLYHAAKSLTYFEPADQEPLPKMIKSISWQQTKQFFLDQTPQLSP